MSLFKKKIIWILEARKGVTSINIDSTDLFIQEVYFEGEYMEKILIKYGHPT